MRARRWHIAPYSLAILVVFMVCAPGRVHGEVAHSEIALQPEHGAPGERQRERVPDQHAVAEGKTAEGEHEPGIFSLLARLANFAILVGVLVYFLRLPAMKYLSDRGQQIRRDLVAADEMRRAATDQLAQIDRSLHALPGELDALKKRGAGEIAAEAARIRQAAEAERQRLLDQMRREIDLQLRVARRELVRQAAELAVGLASDRIKQTITTQDQLRLVNRYLQQVQERGRPTA